jgi:galactonate dehydratase
VTPVGWGRRFTENSRFQDLLRLQVIDVLRPDVGLNGISSVRRAAALSEAYYTAVAPFHRGGPIGAAAALQIAASIPNFVVQEVAFSMDERERRMHEDIADGSASKVVDGFFELPTEP